jgi:hypothetical protein
LPETLCPACGFSPIPKGADECPACAEPFTYLPTHRKAQKRFIDPLLDAESPESTTFGGAITGAVTAHPITPGIAFLTGAAIWFLRASGILVELNEPGWLYAMAIVDLLIPIQIFINLGPARFFAQLAALGQLGVAVWLGREDFANPLHLLFVGHGVVLLLSVSGEPGTLRRAIVLSMACGAAAAAAAVLGLLGMRVSATELGGTQEGFKLKLPPGYVAFTRDEIRAAMHLPPGGPVPFGNPVERLFGLVLVSPDAKTPLISGCEALQKSLGGDDEPKPLPHRAPAGMGQAALVYPLHTPSGGVGRLACAKRVDGRFAALALVVLGADPAIAESASERAFDDLGGGLTLP